MDQSRKSIYLFGKKPEFRAQVETALKSDEASISYFSATQECLDRLAARACDLLIVDLDGCERGGLDVVAQAKRMAPWVPCLAVVERSALPCAVSVIKAGACDCLEKPVPQDRLHEAIEMVLTRIKPSASCGGKPLTEMEAQVLQMILAGKTNQDIAAKLRRSRRTIDVHRRKIMLKLHVCGIVDLVRQALRMGFADSRGESRRRR